MKFISRFMSNRVFFIIIRMGEKAFSNVQIKFINQLTLTDVEQTEECSVDFSVLFCG